MIIENISICGVDVQYCRMCSVSSLFAERLAVDVVVMDSKEGSSTGSAGGNDMLVRTHWSSSGSRVNILLTNVSFHIILHSNLISRSISIIANYYYLVFLVLLML